ncbi:MAG: sulfite exporter TauE/SafE family protein [Bacteroidota bacterium]
MNYLEAFIIGLMGSFHCLGMCGPLALALPLKEGDRNTRLISSFLYNSGRILTYGMMGVVFGILGRGFFLGGIQQWVSITLGSLMVLSVIFPIFFKRLSLEKMTAKMLGSIKLVFARLFGIRTYRSLLAIGLLNGLLPCGLVYIGLAGAVVSHSPWNGFIFMIVFGLGTFPMMFFIPVIGNIISLKFRKKMSRLLPVFILVIGLLFIVRGMNLGIPYVSPAFDKEHPIKPKCCQQP